MTTITIILLLAGLYLVLGLLFAIPFLVKGITQIDEGAHGSGWGFRLIILPGIMIFWPFLFRKWLAASKKIRP